MSLLHFLVVAALIATGFAEITQFNNCAESSDEICNVTEVRITPCKKRHQCPIVKGNNASITFDFTPNFTTSNLKTMVFWAQGAVDIPFAGFGSDDACSYTNCPTQPGSAQTLNYNLHVSKKLPKGVFNLVWKVWNVDDEKQVCCFKTSIELKKSKN